MSNNLSDKEIALEILKTLMEQKLISYDDFPEETSYSGLICRTYEKIFKCVNDAYNTITTN